MMTDKEIPQTRTTEEEQDKTHQKEKGKVSRAEKRKQRRKFRLLSLALWQKMLLVLAFFFFCIITGLFVGYVIVGGPDDALSIYNWRTWVDLYDFISGN